MSRINPTNVGLPSSVRMDKAGTIAGFSDLHVVVDDMDCTCPKCRQTAVGHDSYTKYMAHVVGDSPCTLTVKIFRYRYKRFEATKSADAPLASVVSPTITTKRRESQVSISASKKKKKH